MPAHRDTQINMKGGVLDYKPTHPGHNYKKGEVPKCLTPPIHAWAPTQNPPLCHQFLINNVQAAHLPCCPQTVARGVHTEQ